jgi:hypothetical protein
MNALSSEKILVAAPPPQAFAFKPGVRRFQILFLAAACCVALGSAPASAADGESPSAHWWNQDVQAALDQAETNQAGLTGALESVPERQRDGLAFLLANMSRFDLRRLSAPFLLENTSLAYQAWESSPWRARVSKELFLNEVLPYVNITETREPWRKSLRDLCAPLVKDCWTAGAAAQRLNEKLFGLVKVKYSTQRRRADQSPAESMETGLASCTGLSILLVDACRSVGVPARLAGVPNWSDDRGNHTWVEVWDERWHFAGAAEPDANGLDHAWFQHDASLAVKDSKEHAIYAVSFARTSLPFPTGWARGQDYVSAVNVTDRYAAPVAAKKSGRTRLMVKVMDGVGGQRVTAAVHVLDGGTKKTVGDGSTRDERSDTNDLLSFDLLSDHKYVIEVSAGLSLLRREIALGASAQEMATVYLKQPDSSILPGCAMPATARAALPKAPQP